MKRNFASVAAILCLCAIVCGCSKGPKKPADLPKLNPTTVTVTYDDGTPVEGATVAFLSSQTGGRTWNLTAVTDAAGKITLKTDGNWTARPREIIALSSPQKSLQLKSRPRLAAANRSRASRASSIKSTTIRTRRV